MSRLIESIRLENGVLARLPYHQQRMDRSVSDLFGVNNPWNLKRELDRCHLPDHGLWKVRVVYNDKEIACEQETYTSRPIRSLKKIYDDDISYPYKFRNREALVNATQLREGCDDILIIRRGLVTDSSYANIVFQSGDEWITPASCLLPGTMRQFLIDTKQLTAERISESDIKNFQSFRLINAMLGWEHPAVDVSNIH